jgi:Uncharacterised nucleotidyltransferase
VSAGVSLGVSSALRHLLADRAAVPRPAGPEAHAAALLHAHALATIARLFERAGLEVLLVKGAALGLTVYPEPAARPMGDIDLLVRPGDRDRVVAALIAGGCEERPLPGRRHSAELLGETVLLLRAGAMTEIVEVHTSLDKVVTRPVDTGGLFARAARAPGLPGLLVPAPEDHALLVALHAASHGFAHAAGFLDLELLLRGGLDRTELVARARAWQLSTVMFVMLSTMRELGAASVTDDLVAELDPGPLRRAILRRVVGGSAPALGVEWILAQTPLRDDLAAWLAGLARYAAARVRDRAPLARGARRVQDVAVPAVPYRVPLWVRAVLFLDRAAGRAENVRAGLRDELLLAWVPPADRARLTATLYSDLSTYLPGGDRFKSGLFTWEKRALEAAAFPRSGRALIGAAGAGRELLALVERGFEVLAFDPCKPFAEAAKRVAHPGKATVVHASYRDLVDAVAGRGGPLAAACAGPPFDAVVLGWGSLSHVMPAVERVDLLRAVRKLAPDAPVLASFALDNEGAAPASGKGRVREGLRRVFAALGAPGTSEHGDYFYPSTGFFSYLSSDEVVQLAWETGYEIALFEDSPYPHALLLPMGRRGPREAGPGFGAACGPIETGPREAGPGFGAARGPTETGPHRHPG